MARKKSAWQIARDEQMRGEPAYVRGHVRKGRPVRPHLRDARYRNKRGRVVFDDPEVEDINRFHEENGPKGVWNGPNGTPSEDDIEEVRFITGNPNFGRPRKEWR